MQEKAKLRNAMARSPNKSKQAYVISTWRRCSSPLVCATLLIHSVDQLTTAPVAERLFIRTIRMDISTSNQHITFPTNPPTRAPFGHSPQPKTSGLPPCNRAARSPWAPNFSIPRRYPPQTRESITPQPLNPPSIDDTSQIHDLQQLSLLQSNIQPTHSHSS